MQLCLSVHIFLLLFSQSFHQINTSKAAPRQAEQARFFMLVLFPLVWPDMCG